MGVPKFAAWLTKKYPDMCSEGIPEDVHGLYVDLNGLIHPCCHSEDDPGVALRSEEEKLMDICLSIETLVVTTRPRQVLYIAVDGVAPRAKMNQQRARRYMSAAVPSEGEGTSVFKTEDEYTTEEKAETIESLKEVEQSLQEDPLYGGGGLGDILPDPEALLISNKEAKPLLSVDGASHRKDAPRGAFDSNCLSPGTVFMEKVSLSVRQFIEKKLLSASETTDGEEEEGGGGGSGAVWGELTVVFSDSNVPGEGEHKLIDFLRTQSCFSGFNGHGAHVLAGLDADLIFLALSLHIPKIIILRDNGRLSPWSEILEKRNHKAKPIKTRVVNGDEEEEAEEEDVGGEVTGEEKASSESEMVVEEGNEGNTAAGMRMAKNMTYQYYDIDVVGSSIVSEINQLCLVKNFRLKDKSFIANIKASNGYLFFPDATSSKFEHIYNTFHPCQSACNSKIIDDFIVMGMIMGNDFLPRTPACFCGESVMDTILEIYIRDVLPYGYLTSGDHDIDLTQLSRFLKGFAEVEAMLFRQYAIQSEKMTPAESLLPFPSLKDEEVWREVYYSTTSITQEREKVQESCFYYIQGLRFVWSYYSKTSQQVSWSWQYPFFHAPFCYDMYCFLQRKEAEAQAKGESLQSFLPPAPLEKEAPNTVTQLLCILPPTSAGLVPECFRETMQSPPTEELRRTFPKTWQVDYTASFGKEHLATVMTPLADLDQLKALVLSRLETLSEGEKKRNTNRSYHLVYRLPCDTATAETAYQFAIQGEGLRPLDDANPYTESARGLLHDDTSATLEWFTLTEVPPERSRPRTYTFQVNINNLTELPDGSRFRVVTRRGRYNKRGKHSSESKTTQSSDRSESGGASKKESSASGVPSVPNFAHFHLFLFGLVLLVVCVLHYHGPRSLPLLLLPLLQIVSVFLCSLFLSYLLGFATFYHQKGSGVERNTIPASLPTGSVANVCR